MPLPIVRIKVCKACGKVLQTKAFPDALSPEEFQQFTNKNENYYCKKCRLKMLLPNFKNER